MRESLQAKVAHFARCGEYPNIQQALTTSGNAISNAILQITSRDESMLDIEQLWLPTKKGGLGIQHLAALDAVVCKSGFLSAAALAQQALAQACDSFQPFKRVSGQQMEQLWHSLSNICTCKGACICYQMQAISLDDALNGGMLPGLQRAMSVEVADITHGQLLNRYQARLACADSRVPAEQHLARLHRVQHSVATAWLNILPAKEQWHIDDDTVK
jgi:hypothetical protein